MSTWGTLEADFTPETDPQHLLELIEGEIEERLAPVGSENGLRTHLGNEPGSTFYDHLKPTYVHAGGNLRDMLDEDSTEVFAWWCSHAMHCSQAELLWTIQGWGPQYVFEYRASRLQMRHGILCSPPDMAIVINRLSKKADLIEAGDYNRLGASVFREAAKWTAQRVGYA